MILNHYHQSNTTTTTTFTTNTQTPEDWRSNGATIITSIIGCQPAQQPNHQPTNEKIHSSCHDDNRKQNINHNIKCPANCSSGIELSSSSANQLVNEVKTETNSIKPNVDQQTQSNYYTMDNNGNRETIDTKPATIVTISEQRSTNQVRNEKKFTF